MPCTDEDYIHFNPFEGDEAKIECRSVSLVRVRKPQSCFFGLEPLRGDKHVIQPGERARYEKALIDGSFWGRYYVCLPCMDRWLGDTEESDE